MSLKTYKTPEQVIRVKHNERHLWELFHPHHYMSDSLASGASFYTFYLYKDGKETLVACCGVIPQISKNPSRRITRFVILPEYQGLGLTGPILDTISQYYYNQVPSIKMYIVTFHKRLGNHLENSDNWSPSANNGKVFKTAAENFEDTDYHSGQRDGVAMYRYFYSPQIDKKYSLVYDVLEISALNTKRQNANKEKRVEINKILKEKNQFIKDLQDKLEGKDLQVLNDIEAKEIKETHNKIFKKNKRKKITPEQRRKMKEDYAKNKN